MNKEEFKKLIKESVKEVLAEELHQLIGTIIKSSMEPIMESVIKLNANNQSVPVAPITVVKEGGGYPFKGTKIQPNLINRDEILSSIKNESKGNILVPQPQRSQPQQSLQSLKKNPSMTDILNAPPAVDPGDATSSGPIGMNIDNQLLEKMVAINSRLMKGGK